MQVKRSTVEGRTIGDVLDRDRVEVSLTEQAHERLTEQLARADHAGIGRFFRHFSVFCRLDDALMKSLDS
jgi:hypothetical protein